VLPGLVGRDSGPPPRHLPKGRLVLWPVVECFRVEVGAVGPDEGVDLGVDGDLAEESGIAQGAVDFAG